MMTIGNLVKTYTEKFKEAGISDARFEVYTVLSEVLEVNRMDLQTRPDMEIDETSSVSALDRYLKGEPVSYITGKAGFYMEEYKVVPGVLIPRPDTEILVENAADFLNPANGEIKYADLCTGTGCVGISLAGCLRRNGIKYKAVLGDISETALKCATENTENISYPDISINRIDVLNENEVKTFFGKEKLDLIVSNPPYISYEEMEELDSAVADFEPHLALEAAKDGLEFYYPLASEAMYILKNGGALMVEHGYLQGDKVRNIFAEAGLSGVYTVKDYGGNDRVTIGYKGTAHEK